MPALGRVAILSASGVALLPREIFLFSRLKGKARPGVESSMESLPLINVLKLFLLKLEGSSEPPRSGDNTESPRLPEEPFSSI